MPRTVKSNGNRNQPGRWRIWARVSTVASSAVSMASKARTARPSVWVASRLHASTSRASRDGAGMSPKNRWRSPCSNAAPLGSGARSSSPRRSATARRAASRAPPLVPNVLQRTRSTCRSGGAGGSVGGPTTTVCRPARLRSHTASQRSCIIVCRLVMSTVVSSCILCNVLSSRSACIDTSHLYAGFPHRHQTWRLSTLTPPSARDVPERGLGTPPRLFSMPTAIFLALHGFVSRRLIRVWCPTAGHCPDKLDGM